jgi:hypothetical protein
MRALILTFLFLAGFAPAQAEQFEVNRLLGNPSPSFEVAGNCTLNREATSGSEKFCYYNCIDGEKTVTIDASAYCPLDLD